MRGFTELHQRYQLVSRGSVRLTMREAGNTVSDVIEMEDNKKPWNWKNWYAENKEDLAKKRNGRYQSDPDYRTKVLAQNKAYREKKAAENASLPRPTTRLPKIRKPVLMTVEINGSPKEMQLMHIGTFARSIERSVAEIGHWERSNLLPKTPFVHTAKTKRERLYTAEMIQAAKTVLRHVGGDAWSGAFYEEVSRAWKSLGVKVDSDE